MILKQVPLIFILVKKNPGINPMGNDNNHCANLFHRRSKKKELSSAMGRELSFFEYDMITYPRLCMTCLSGVQVINLYKY